MSGKPKRSRRGWTPLTTFTPAPTPLRSSLDMLASTLGLTNVDTTTALLVNWPEIVGDQLASHCTPKSLRNRVITIEAHDQQWATELKWMTSLIIERCCEALGPDTVDEVRIIR